MEPRRYNRLNVAPSDSPKGGESCTGGKNLTLLGEKLDCKRYLDDFLSARTAQSVRFREESYRAISTARL